VGIRKMNDLSMLVPLFRVAARDRDRPRQQYLSRRGGRKRSGGEFLTARFRLSTRLQVEAAQRPGAGAGTAARPLARSVAVRTST
jgi:hypothetical protein